MENVICSQYGKTVSMAHWANVLSEPQYMLGLTLNVSDVTYFLYW